jgi:hypothetical protein
MKNKPLPGTTIGVLAPYLEHHLEIEMIGTKQRGVLFGLSTSDHAYVLFAGESELQRVAVKNFLPVLRPFEDLYRAEIDGEVPAIELTRLAWGKLARIRHPRIAWDTVRADYWNTGTVDVFQPAIDPEEGEYSDILLSLYPDGSVQTTKGIPVPLSVYQYLYQHHFALGLKPHQYVTKHS